MKFIKTFESLNGIKKGDIVVWTEGISDIDRRGRSWTVAPISRQVKYGDKCEVTNVKKVKNEIYVKLKKLDNNLAVCKLFDTNGRRVTYSRDGNWLSSYYVSKLEDIKDDDIKYKKYIILNFKTEYENTYLIVEIENKKFEQYTVNIITTYDKDGNEFNYEGDFTISSSKMKKSFVYESNNLDECKEYLEVLLSSLKYNL